MPLPSIPTLLRRHGIRPGKKRGQHFLIDETTVRRIAQAAGIDAETAALEIGPGTGVLTRHLVETARHVVAVEIDRKLCALLRREFSACPNLTITEQDILHTDMKKVCNSLDTQKLVVIGNLPYNITGPMIERLLKYRPVIRRAVIMVQEEVGRRLAACPGGKIYGALSVVVQYAYHVHALFHVPADSFYPRPTIRSVVLELTPHPRPPVDVRDEALFYRFIRASFQHRRKMLHHAVTRITNGKSDVVTDRTGIDLRRRAETLSLEEFALIANAISSFS